MLLAPTIRSLDRSLVLRLRFQAVNLPSRIRPGMSNDPNDKSAMSRLTEIASIPTSRFGRLLRAGWAARHAVPLAVKRASELLSADGKEGRKVVAEKALKEQERAAEELFKTLGTLKGVALKVGQVASYVEGIIPSEFETVYRQVLSRLQAAAPGLPPAASREAIEEELGRSLDDLFLEFDEHPFAAASIGQVHRAVLPDGTPVAVKVQYPEVDRAFQSDLRNMRVLEKVLGPLIRYYNSTEALEVLRNNLLLELDYEREADAQERYSEQYRDDPQILIPRVFRDLCSRKVLVTELARGLSFDEVLELPQEKLDEFGKVLVRYYLESIHHHNFLNPDPHPGNYVFGEDGAITFLDFGAALDLDPVFTSGLQASTTAAMDGDLPTFRRSVKEVYGVDDSNPAVFDSYVEIMLTVLQPCLPQFQPFRFSGDWIDSYIDETASHGKTILTRGGKIPKLPSPVEFHTDVLFIERVAIGLASILSRMGATADWSELTREVFKGAD